MFRNLSFRAKYKSYVYNEHGIKKFAEMCMGQLIRKATKKSAFYREMNENLLVEKANLRMRRDELYERPSLDGGHFFSVRRRLWANSFLIAVIVLAAVMLNILSVEAFIQDASAVDSGLRWSLAILIAIVFTGGGLIVAERLIGVVIPRRDVEEDNKLRRQTRLKVLWGLLLFAVEIVLLGLAEVKADALSGDGNALLYFGYITASMILPLIAGTFRWDGMRFIDRYKTTQSLRQIESRLAQIDSVLRQNEEYESNFYKIKSIEYWDLVNDFKTYKDNINERLGIVENLGGHFAQTYDLFQAEANKRYAMDIRDVTAKSLRKLELSDASRGRKIGQAPDQPGIRSRASSGANGNTGSDKDEFMNLKPIR